MSRSRLNLHSSRPSLRPPHHPPLLYRQVILQRNGHHPLPDALPDLSSLKNRQSVPAHTATQQLTKLHPARSLSQQQHYLSQPNQANSTAKLRLATLQHPSTLQPPPNQIHLKTSLQKLVDRVGQLQNHPIPSVQPATVEDGKMNTMNATSVKPIPERKESIHEKLRRIDEKINSLVTRKLELVAQQTKKNKDLTQSLLTISKQDINHELQQLIEQIRTFQSKNDDISVPFLTQKISFIETLLAEQATEGELMKKHYYSLSSNKSRAKIGEFTHKKGGIAQIFKNLSKFEKNAKSRSPQLSPLKQPNAKPLFKESSNKRSYKHPSLGDYESYRYKPKQAAVNLQPLPSSSYKRDYHYMKSQPDQKIVNRDHSPYNPLSKQTVGSIYEQDYRSIKADITNHKELDAYHNKYKVLKVNYMPKSRLQTMNYDRQIYRKDFELSDSRSRSLVIDKQRTSMSQNQINFNKNVHISEAHREYMGESTIERSRIKHKQLKDLQYKLKNLYKA